MHSFGDRTLTSEPGSGPIPTTRSVASEFPKEETTAQGATHTVSEREEGRRGAYAVSLRSDFGVLLRYRPLGAHFLSLHRPFQITKG